jgi:hypothetical protein
MTFRTWMIERLDVVPGLFGLDGSFRTYCLPWLQGALAEAGQ